MAVKCSFDLEFNGACDCGATFSGNPEGPKVRANKKKHSRSAVNFLLDKVLEIKCEGGPERGVPWSQEEEAEIARKLKETNYKEEEILGLLDRSFTGAWCASLKVLGWAGQSQKDQREHRGGPKMQSNIDIHYVDENTKWEKVTPHREGEYSLRDSGVIGKFNHREVIVGEDTYSRALAKCNRCAYEVERVHDLRKHHRNVHKTNCLRHGIPCSAHRASDGQVHEVALQTMSNTRIRWLQKELTYPVRSRGWEDWGITALHQVSEGDHSFGPGSSKSHPRTSHNVERRGSAPVRKGAKRAKRAPAGGEAPLVHQAEEQEVDDPEVRPGAELGDQDPEVGGPELGQGEAPRGIDLEVGLPGNPEGHLGTSQNVFPADDLGARHRAFLVASRANHRVVFVDSPVPPTSLRAMWGNF